MARQHNRQCPITGIMSTRWETRSAAMVSQHREGVKVLHSTEKPVRVPIESLEFSPGFSWPSTPLVAWPPSLLELYFDMLEAEVMGR